VREFLKDTAYRKRVEELALTAEVYLKGLYDKFLKEK
jgi:hypothetical protein